MILRRIAEHLRNQHWTAVFIELLVVIFGVFLGAQLTSWNDARVATEDYVHARERLSAEIDTNLASIAVAGRETTEVLPAVSEAIEMLRTCGEKPDSVSQVNAALTVARGTNTISFRRIALDEMTTNPRLLARQSQTERQRFADLSVYLHLMEKTIGFAEDHPLEQRIEDIDVLSLGAAEQARTFEFQGRTYVKMLFPLVLNVSFAEACRSESLKKALFTWHRWQSNLPIYAEELRTEFEATKAVLSTNR